jgi:hypothetical protein
MLSLKEGRVFKKKSFAPGKGGSLKWAEKEAPGGRF